MKTQKFLTIITLAALSSFAFVGCTEDDPQPLPTYSISGVVTYPDFTGAAVPAAGAMVYMKLNSLEATTSFDVTAVTDVNGNYEFTGLEAGNYSLYAVYDTENTNIPDARVTRVIFIGEPELVTIEDASQAATFSLTSLGQANAMAVNTTEGGDWSSDMIHSSVGFEFPYAVENATFTGRFSSFSIVVNFDPANLAGSSISASVDLLTINTGTPGGRDPLWEGAWFNKTLWQDSETQEYNLGCIAGNFGITNPDDADRTATFTSNSIEVYGDGYLAKGPMKFNGVTMDISFFFKFIPGFQAENRQGALTQFSSFEGFFNVAAKAGFNVDTSQIGNNPVTILVSYQVTKAI